MSQARPAGRWTLAAGIIPALAALLPFRGYIFQLASRLPVAITSGSNPAGRDAFVFCWNFWWTRGWLAGAHPLFYSRSIFYPFGVSLSHHTLTPANSVPAALLVNILPLPLIYNAFLVFHGILTGLGVYLLTARLAGKRLPAVLAGVFAVLFPARVNHLAAHLNVAGTAWLPWALWALLSAWESAKKRYVALGGVCIALTGASSRYLLLGLLLGFWVVISGERPRLPRARRALLAWCIGGVLLLPAMLPMLANTAHIPPRDAPEKSAYSVTLPSLVTPPRGYLLHAFSGGSGGLAAYRVETLENMAYLGLPGALLILAGLLYGDRNSRRWLSGGILLLVFSLGPFLTLFHTRIPLPYLLLDGIPGLRMGRTPGRLMIPAGMLLAVGIGCFLARLRLPPGRAGLLQLAFLGAVLADFFPPALPTARAVLPDAYTRLPPVESDAPAILEIPCAWQIRDYQFFQAFHGRPVTSGFVARIPPKTFYRMSELPLWAELSGGDRAAEILRKADPVALWDLASILKAGTVIIHRDLISGGFRCNSSDIARRWSAGIAWDGPDLLVLKIHHRRPPEATYGRFYYTDNWYPRELWPPESLPVRWAMGRQAEGVVFIPENATGRLHFEVFSLPPAGGRGQALTVRIGGETVCRKDIRRFNTWIPVTCPLPRACAPRGATVRFDFAAGTVPAGDPQLHSRDDRFLSGAVRNVSVEVFP